jgi:serine/threonine protein phosphatase PrpC
MLLEGQNRKSLVTTGTPRDDHSIPAAITDTGCERELNEDRYAVIESTSGVAWLVCDGMGGTTGGELAAQLAIDAIRRDLEKYQGRAADHALRSAIVEANRVIVLRRQNQAFSSMGTTIVGVIFDGSEVAVASIGDSRAYLIRDGAIQQLTVDHTYVQQLVDRGEIRAEEALAHPQAHILTRCVGAEPGIDVDVSKFWVWPVTETDARDSLMLCSDGLYSLVSEGEIAATVCYNSPQTACVKLVELAKARGGFDNITVAVIPLTGQMRKTAPPNYREKPGRSEDDDEMQASVPRRGGFTKHILLVGLLCALAVLATGGVYLFLHMFDNGVR